MVTVKSQAVDGQSVSLLKKRERVKFSIQTCTGQQIYIIYIIMVTL